VLQAVSPAERAVGMTDQNQDSMNEVPTVTLNDGHAMPVVGFGVFLVPEDQTHAAVTTALQTGYRSVDTAALYGNETAVGKAIADSNLPREDLFVTTKVWNSDHGFDATMAAFNSSIRRLDLDYIDLYLIHWPMPARNLYLDTWRALERLQADGRVRSIGVSNFGKDQLQRLLDRCHVVPAVNQIELHPELTQDGLRRFHDEHGIVTEAWSPLARGAVLAKSPIVGLAEKYAKTPAQLVLRWHLQLGNVVIPKSVSPARIRENFAIFDFEIADDDMAEITAIDNGTRVGPDPATFNRA
jgi:2,5-diketo-D-gluconate reductase A